MIGQICAPITGGRWIGRLLHGLNQPERPSRLLLRNTPTPMGISACRWYTVRKEDGDLAPGLPPIEAIPPHLRGLCSRCLIQPFAFAGLLQVRADNALGIVGQCAWHALRSLFAGDL